MSNADESTPTVTLTGAIVGQSESRGKTMAAWNGVPAGETYFKLTLDPGQTRPEGAPEEPILRVPGADPSKGWVGKRVRITGRWTTPAPVETHVDAGGGHMMEMQAPIRAVNPASAGAEDPGAAEVVPREPILIADRVEII